MPGNIALIIRQRVELRVADQTGRDPHVAADLARAVEIDIRQQLGGSYYYVPKPDRRERMEEVLKARAGDVAATCARFGISRATLYRWLQKWP